MEFFKHTAVPDIISGHLKMLYSAFHETWPLHCCLSDYFPSSETIEKTLMSLYIVSSRHFNYLHLHGQYFIPLIFVNFLLSLPFCYCLGLQDHFLSSLCISTNASLHSIPLWGQQGLPPGHWLTFDLTQHKQPGVTPTPSFAFLWSEGLFILGFAQGTSNSTWCFLGRESLPVASLQPCAEAP